MVHMGAFSGRGRSLAADGLRQRSSATLFTGILASFMQSSEPISNGICVTWEAAGETGRLLYLPESRWWGPLIPGG